MNIDKMLITYQVAKRFVNLICLEERRIGKANIAIETLECIVVTIIVAAI